jgi:hypothetical protein
MTDFLDIIHRLFLILKNHNVSETGVCLRHQVKGDLLLGPIDRASPYLRIHVKKVCHFSNTPSSQIFRI